MREIFFRGKRIDNGKWIEGYYWTNGIDNHFIKVIKDKSGNFVSNAINNNFEVESNTVGQYTGLEDANGKKIFEGDILKDRESMVIVRFVDGEFSVDYKTLGGKWRHYENLFNYLEDYEGEAVGNIHDNPELVKEKIK